LSHIINQLSNPNGMLQSVRMYEGPGSLVGLEFSQVISLFSHDISFCILFKFWRKKREKTRLLYQPIRSDLCYLWSSSRYDSLPDMWNRLRCHFSRSLSLTFTRGRIILRRFWEIGIPTLGEILYLHKAFACA